MGDPIAARRDYASQSDYPPVRPNADTALSGTLTTEDILRHRRYSALPALHLRQEMQQHPSLSVKLLLQAGAAWLGLF